MGDLRKAAQAVGDELSGYNDDGKYDTLLEALRAALAQEAEPVAWLIDWPDEPSLGHYLSENPSASGRSRPLYFAPPASVPALSLTEEQIDAYIADYELEGDDGTHTPTEGERFLLKDAIMGLTAEHAPAAVSVTDAMVAALRDIEMAACYGTEEDPDAGPSMLRTIGEIARKALAEIDSAQTESKSRTPPADPEVPR